MPSNVSPRRFPPPWSVKELQERFVVQNGQALAYLYFDDDHVQETLQGARLQRHGQGDAPRIAPGPKSE